MVSLNFPFLLWKAFDSTASSGHLLKLTFKNLARGDLGSGLASGRRPCFECCFTSLSLSSYLFLITNFTRFAIEHLYGRSNDVDGRYCSAEFAMDTPSRNPACTPLQDEMASNILQFLWTASLPPHSRIFIWPFDRMLALCEAVSSEPGSSYRSHTRAAMACIMLRPPQNHVILGHTSHYQVPDLL